MGKEKTTTETQTSPTTQTQRATPTPEETELQQIQLGQVREFDPLQRELNQIFGGLAKQLGTGGDLPGFLSSLTTGISPEAIGQQATKLAGRAGAGFQNLGILDSGVAFRETARGIANELLFPAEASNLERTIQLLNLGLGGGTALQQTGLAAQGQLGGALAGLRTVTGTTSGGTVRGTTTGMNPFLKSFQTSLGQTLGGPKVSAGPFSFGGR